MDNKSLKENIYNRRKELGLSQECVAEQLDISLNAYIKIEKGPTRIVNPKLEKIAQALDTTPEALVLGPIITMEQHEEVCREIEEQYNAKLDGYRAAIEEKELFLKRLNEMVSDKNDLISSLKSEITRLESLLAATKEN